MLIRNEEIAELRMETPAGHKHLRARVLLQDGRELVFQEASVANLVRAYITVKTHPTIHKLRLKGQRLTDQKEDYAEWQLLEAEEAE